MVTLSMQSTVTDITSNLDVRHSNVILVSETLIAKMSALFIMILHVGVMHNNVSLI